MERHHSAQGSGRTCGLQRRRWLGATLALLATLQVGTVAHAAHATAGMASPDENAGTWDLSFEKGNRRCRLTLRVEGMPPGYAVAMPAGCHRAFPTLASVTNWTPAANHHVVFRTASGEAAMDFGPHRAPSLSATASEDETYELTPTDPSRRDVLMTATTEAEAVAPAPVGVPTAALSNGVMVDDKAPTAKAAKGAAAIAPLPPVTTSEVAGHYAVLRDNRDTGCMVTLDGETGARSNLKARLAPACRDQGIVIFDPVAWTLLKGQLVLTAKKGHSTALTHVQTQTWANAPAKGAVLVLKRL